MTTLRTFLAVLVFVSAGQAQAKMWLPSIFGDHMVLQQQADIAIWGSDLKALTIDVKTSWGESAQTVVNSAGRWEIRLKTPAAGGPHWLTIDGSDTVTLKDLLIGEVWVASGQSNMEMPMAGYANQPVLNSSKAIAASENNQIRLFTVERASSQYPLHRVGGEWRAATPASVRDFSAVAYYFAEKLYEKLGVPVGIVSASWSASTIEAWMDVKTLSQHDNSPLREALPNVPVQQQPGLLYNAMIHPLAGFGMKGVIWYQGEANRERASEYRALLPAMISSWRHQWGMGDFSFYYAQIAPFNYGRTNSAFLREAQLLTMDVVPNSGMAVTLDIGNCHQIHPADKRTVGHRLARWPLAKEYGKSSISYSGPIYRDVQFDETGKATLSFDHADGGFSKPEDSAEGFEIAGSNKKFYPARAQLATAAAKVIVWSEAVPEPVAVRYAFKNCPASTLFNVEGLPASSFRTDQWDEPLSR